MYYITRKGHMQIKDAWQIMAVRPVRRAYVESTKPNKYHRECTAPPMFDSVNSSQPC